MIYGKSKHGLTIQSGHGFGWGSDIPEFEKSLLICYDRKKQKRDMPRQHHIVTPNKDEYGGFYNALGYLKFNQQMISEITEITSILRQIISIICTTHLAFATNCGEGYLPYLIKDNKIGINFFMISPSQEDERVSSEIAIKITDSMNIVQVRLGLFTEIIDGSQQFLNSLVNDSVTNVWIDPYAST